MISFARYNWNRNFSLVFDSLKPSCIGKNDKANKGSFWSKEPLVKVQVKESPYRKVHYLTSKKFSLKSRKSFKNQLILKSRIITMFLWNSLWNWLCHTMIHRFIFLLSSRNIGSSSADPLWIILLTFQSD